MPKIGSLFRRMAKRALEHPLVFPVRERLLLRQALRDSVSATQIAAQLGHQKLDWRNNELFKSSDREVLYILGGGSSINDLSPANFERISQGSSVGINVWAVHPFVPDVYSFESAAQLDGVPGEVEFLEACLSKPTVIEKQPRVILLRQRVAAGETQIIGFPDELQRGVFVSGRVNLVTRAKQNLARDLERALRLIVRGRIPPNVLLDNGASVVRLIVLGFLQGFKKIVLVGIDLDARPYFWLSENYAHSNPELARLFPRNSGVPHDTLETTSRPFAADEVIVELAKILRRWRGVRVVVGSKSSLLADRLETYEWG